MLLQSPPLSIVELIGKDAQAILHNLTTNDIRNLSVDGAGVETFLTNVKGKCVGHVLVFRIAEGYRLIGAGGQSEAIAELMDRYTIREDATPQRRDADWQAWVWIDVLDSKPATSELRPETIEVRGGQVTVDVYRVPWCEGISLDQGGFTASRCVLVPADVDMSVQEIASAIKRQRPQDDASETPISGSTADVVASDTVFHAYRVAANFPWYGIDITDAHLPQEISREPQTISFTKGCYLGQETVARLDALGQVQKKLVQWLIRSDTTGASDLPAPDSKCFADGDPNRAVGRLTSVAAIRPEFAAAFSVTLSNDSLTCPADGLAIGFARRSHFEAGAEAVILADPIKFHATVLGDD